MMGRFVMIGLVLAGCASNSDTGCVSKPGGAQAESTAQSDVVQKILTQFKQSPSKAPEAIYGYELDGKPVFLAIAPCCDQYNPLYDEKGNQLCSPSGGFAGNGDGKCDDFNAKKKKERLLWKP